MQYYSLNLARLKLKSIRLFMYSGLACLESWLSLLRTLFSSAIVFTNGAEWNELFPRKRVKNRGISGDTSEGVYDRLDALVKGKPAKIFILIGINDISRGIEVETIVQNMKRIVEKIQNESPKTKIYKIIHRQVKIREIM